MTHKIKWTSRAYRLWLYEPGMQYEVGLFPSKAAADFVVQHARYYFALNGTLKGFDLFSTRAVVSHRFDKGKSPRRN